MTKKLHFRTLREYVINIEEVKCMCAMEELVDQMSQQTSIQMFVNHSQNSHLNENNFS